MSMWNTLRIRDGSGDLELRVLEPITFGDWLETVAADVRDPSPENCLKRLGEMLGIEDFHWLGERYAADISRAVYKRREG
jgi:hypothetical protein